MQEFTEDLSKMTPEELEEQKRYGEMEAICEDHRKEIQLIGKSVKQLKKNPVFGIPEEFEGQQSEMIANIMIAYRHLEDARMRLGKVMQQIQGGVSIFDKDK
jgi:hypothetical protein